MDLRSMATGKKKVVKKPAKPAKPAKAVSRVVKKANEGTPYGCQKEARTQKIRSKEACPEKNGCRPPSQSRS